MKKKTKLEFILLTFALFSGLSMLTGLSLQAGIPFGTITNGPFSGPLVSIYDLTGTYTYSESIPMDEGPPLDVTFDISLSQDGRGKIQGSGSTMITNIVGGMNMGIIRATYKAKGAIKTSADMTRVQLQVDAKGFGTLLGIDQNFEINSKLKAIINALAGSIDGTSKGKAKATELGSSQFNNMASYLLPVTMNGTWFLELDITPNRNKLFGNGAIRLSNGVPLPMGIKKAEYNPKSDESKMKLKGFAVIVDNNILDGLGSSLKKVVLGNSGTQIRLFKGRVMGQKVEWELMPVEAR